MQLQRLVIVPRVRSAQENETCSGIANHLSLFYPLLTERYQLAASSSAIEVQGAMPLIPA